MGIQGLSTFVDKNSYLLTDKQFHDTRVVIDGKNLYFFLHKYFRLNPQCGGDYNTYDQKIKYYFGIFKSCNIEPYVIFDGAYDKSDIKLRTTKKRASDRLNTVRHALHSTDANLVPLLAQETFQCALDDLGIPHATCNFEADREIAALANAWNCPVMSNDSDFYVYDVKAGFILIDYLDLSVKRHEHKKASKGEQSSCTEKNCTKGYKYINAQIYYVDTLLDKFKLKDRNLLPLFATLQGNDYVSLSAFDDFYCKTDLPKQPKNGSVRHKRMTRVLKWFERHQYDVAQATKAVLSRYDMDTRDDIEEKLRLSCETYMDQSTDLVNFFQHDVIHENKVQTQSGANTYCTCSTDLYKLRNECEFCSGPCTNNIHIILVVSWTTLRLWHAFGKALLHRHTCTRISAVHVAFRHSYSVSYLHLFRC